MNSCKITLVGSDLAIYTPYSPSFVAALKATIPYVDRKWDGQRKAWVVSSSYGLQVKGLIQQHYNETVNLPLVTAVTPLQMRLLDVRYIGAAKERGDSKSAFAWSGGDWSVIFPKSVLMAWFGQTQQPNEEATLYGVLGVSQSASADDLKKAWRRLARTWHPDVSKEPGSAEQFHAIQAAYQTLGDADQRAKYDAGLAFEAMTKAHTSLNDTVSQKSEWRPSIRCGLILVEGQEKLGRFVVSKIIQWADIVNSRGQVLVTSWGAGDDFFEEGWVEL